jgi:lysine/ornithine N-monooxygenase
MERTLLAGKIHRATVTQADLHTSELMTATATVDGIVGINSAVAQLISPGRPAIEMPLHVNYPAVDLRCSKTTSGGLFIQGNTEHTHGLTSSLLSNIAVRSAEILQSIDANRLSSVGNASR